MTGLIIGKFYPPHAGHHHLIETALSQVDVLHVVVCDDPQQKPAAPLRAAWLRECHPQAQIHWTPDRYGDAPHGWAAQCISLIGGRPDVVFTSEAYGPGFARALGAQHVAVDPPRQRFPISGTQVRENPWACWAFLRPPVRAFYARRVVILGAESTGKSTLAARLAQHFQTLWVPEYGRTYVEEMPKRGLDPFHYPWCSDDFSQIAGMQRLWEDQAARQCHGLLICDTDALTTSTWHERYLGHVNPWLEQLGLDHAGHLYLLSSPDTPFVQDGFRDGEAIRTWMDQRFEAVLRTHQLPFVRLSGDWAAREAQAITAISHAFSLQVG